MVVIQKQFILFVPYASEQATKSVVCPASEICHTVQPADQWVDINL